MLSLPWRCFWGLNDKDFGEPSRDNTGVLQKKERDGMQCPGEWVSSSR